MSLRKITLLALAPIAALTLSACETTYSQGGKMGDESAFSKEVFNVEKLTCWDLSTISEEDAGYAATLLYGYAQGKMGEATQTPSKIENGLSQLSKRCAGAPDKLIIDTF